MAVYVAYRFPHNLVNPTLTVQEQSRLPVTAEQIKINKMWSVTVVGHDKRWKEIFASLFNPEKVTWLETFPGLLNEGDVVITVVMKLDNPVALRFRHIVKK